jgi:3-oxoacyl-[acyl-carrier-protein] synthase II
VVTACTTSTHAIGLGTHHPVRGRGRRDRRRRGDGHHARGLGSFGQAKALSTRNEAPKEASRPWDRDRDGFVLSTAAARYCSRSLEHAKRRGANIYAELVGFGMSGDAHHITAPPRTEGARLAMANALKDASLMPAPCSTSTRTPPDRASATRPRPSP